MQNSSILKFAKYGPYCWIILISLCYALFIASRASAYIYDEYCPTHPYNFIRQIISVGFPGSFLGAPNIPANYHQGTFLIAAYLASVFNLSPELALKMTLVNFSFLFSIFVLLGLGRLNIRNVLIFIQIILFCNLPSLELLKAFFNGAPINPWFSYLIFSDYFVSTSWPVGLFLTSFFFYCSKNNVKLISLAILLVVMPFFNATLFQVLFIAGITTNLIYSKKIKFFKELLVYLIVYLIVTRTYTNALSLGEYYDKVDIGFRLINLRLNDLYEYFLLQPIYNWMSIFFIIYYFYFFKINKKQCFIFLAFLFCFFIPIFIYGKNISPWDNIHKFILISEFLSIYIWAYFFNAINGRYFFIFFLTCLIVSVPGMYSYTQSRFSYSWKTSYRPEMVDIISFINSSPKRIMIWKFGDVNLCEDDGYVVSKTAAAFAGGYTNTFLLAPSLEDQIAVDRNWTKNNINDLQDKYPNMDNLILVDNKDLYKFEKEFGDLKIVKVNIFKNYTFYRIQ